MSTSDRSRLGDGSLIDSVHDDVEHTETVVPPAVSNTEAARQAAERRKQEDAGASDAGQRQFSGDVPPPEHGGDDNSGAGGRGAVVAEDALEAERPARWAGVAGAPAPCARLHEDEPLWLVASSLEIGAQLTGATDARWFREPNHESTSLSATSCAWFYSADT